MTGKGGAITADQMRRLEQEAIESVAVTGLELMERAGQAVVEAVLEEWPVLAGKGHKATVFCGPGNNGGRRLRDRAPFAQCWLEGQGLCLW
jgi:NAD(P)H-hydrate repair Nnr-like enzyme with NAD(P)H-hydrate epimerase domain